MAKRTRTTGIGVDLPVLLNGPTATKYCKEGAEESDANEGEADVDLERHVVYAGAEPLVEEEPAYLESPEKNSVYQPAEQLRFGALNS
jgi:hypothetical protein